MKILNLKIEGFRSLKTIDWSPGDLNVVIGPNNGGKSNLLNALEMIAASARGQLAKFVKSQGGMEPLVWDGQAEDLNFDIQTSQFHEINKDALSYTLKIQRGGKTPSYLIDYEHLYMKDRPIELFKCTSTEVVLFDSDGKKEIHKREQTANSETFLSSTDSPFKANQWISQYRKRIVSWKIYSDFHTSRNSSIRQAFITSYEKGIESDGKNFIAVLHTFYEEDRDFRQEINQAMKAAFGDDFEELSFAPAADTRSQLRIFWKSLKKPRSAADISDGTLRFLYLLTILAHPEPPALIAIDEPETGLHPSMLPIIAEYAVEASRKTQVILTTHSPEFLSAFGDNQKDVKVTVAEWEDGQTKLLMLEGETFDYWLDKYSLGELYRSGQLEDME
ncbi:AAA family ATPase [Planctomycetota bacterium]